MGGRRISRINFDPIQQFIGIEIFSNAGIAQYT
jgi:hypothetical protein